ncbi:unnamed protein product [Protopolystoma xenopodis]|uniref:Ion transport domain-containing protein n=1 Tax=Protopolystoma xenopodis TaxID=117903 RepID=A0A3S4ZEA4_9PLAT|nr:unnamed protein product [Protopolystoma xenopodis]
MARFPGAGPTCCRDNQHKAPLPCRSDEAASRAADVASAGRERGRFVDPCSQLLHVWQGIVTLAFLYNLWVIVYRFAFDEVSTATRITWFLADYLADAVYLGDIIVGLHTAHYEEGVLQTTPSRIRAHYMNSTRFYVDLLALLPLDFLYLSIGYMSLVRIIRLAKFRQVLAYPAHFERHTAHPNAFRVVYLLHGLAILFHWNACLHRLVAGLVLYRGAGLLDADFSAEVAAALRDALATWRSPFVTADPVAAVGVDNRTVKTTVASTRTRAGSNAYLDTLYHSTMALTLTGTGLPTPFENVGYLFVLFELVLGLLVFALVLGYISNILSNINAEQKEFQSESCRWREWKSR